MRDRQPARTCPARSDPDGGGELPAAGKQRRTLAGGSWKRLGALAAALGLAAAVAQPGAAENATPLATGGGAGTAAISAPSVPAANDTAEPAKADVPPLPSAGGAQARAAAAAAVLERHCARCHQTGRLERPAAARPVADILDLAALARDPGLVVPGRPDASPLYLSMLTRHMPYDVFHDLARRDEPSPAEIAAVRQWIAGLPERAGCPDRPLLDDTRITERIAADQSAIGPDRSRMRRYLSLAAFHNACGSPPELDAYAAAAARLLNLLSRAPQPIVVERLAPEGAILAFDLTGAGKEPVGWSAAAWEWVIADLPPSSVSALPDGVRSQAGSDRPIAPAHWLAAAASRPEVYAMLLGLPAGLDATFREFAGSTDNSGEPRRDFLGGLAQSAVTGGPRLVHSVPPGDGAAAMTWLAEDLPPGSSLPAAAARVSEGGAAEGQLRLIFSLPNGLPAAALFTNEGSRRDRVARHALPQGVSQAGHSESGLPCLACHSAGPLVFENALAPTQAGETDRAKATASEAAAPEPDTSIAEARERFATAFRRARLDASDRLAGLEPTQALALAWTRDLDLARAASEMALSPEVLAGRLSAHEGELRPVARRLVQGLVSRAEFIALRHELADWPPPANPLMPDRLRLSLWTDQPRYKVGDEVMIHVSATGDCRLTLISVDASGEATVLLPNDLQPDNAIAAGTVHSIPAAGAGYRLRFDRAGEEQLIGICMEGAREGPPGILHDFEIQRFTILGPWERHLETALAADAEERANAGKPEPRRPLRRGGRLVPQPPRRAEPLPLPQARTAITVRIEQ